MPHAEHGREEPLGRDRVAAEGVDHGEHGREQGRELGGGGALERAADADVAVTVGQPGRQQVVGLRVAREHEVVGDTQRVADPDPERDDGDGEQCVDEPAG